MPWKAIASIALLAGMTSSGCTVSPFDGATVSDEHDPFTFAGFSFRPNYQAEVRFLDGPTGSLQPAGISTTGDAVPTAGTPLGSLYAWSVVGTVPWWAWWRGEQGASALVSANGFTVESDGVDCSLANQEPSAWFANCPSDKVVSGELNTVDLVAHRTTTPLDPRVFAGGPFDQVDCDVISRYFASTDPVVTKVINDRLDVRTYSFAPSFDSSTGACELGPQEAGLDDFTGGKRFRLWIDYSANLTSYVAAVQMGGRHVSQWTGPFGVQSISECLPGPDPCAITVKLSRPVDPDSVDSQDTDLRDPDLNPLSSVVTLGQTTEGYRRSLVAEVPNLFGMICNAQADDFLRWAPGFAFGGYNLTIGVGDGIVSDEGFTASAETFHATCGSYLNPN